MHRITFVIPNEYAKQFVVSLPLPADATVTQENVYQWLINDGWNPDHWTPEKKAEDETRTHVEIHTTKWTKTLYDVLYQAFRENKINTMSYPGFLYFEKEVEHA
jgi:hypothetical protein